MVAPSIAAGLRPIVMTTTVDDGYLAMLGEPQRARKTYDERTPCQLPFQNEAQQEIVIPHAIP